MATALVFVIVLITKFTHGAYLVVIAVPIAELQATWGGALERLLEAK